MTVDLNTLLETDDDVRRLFEGRPMQYRKSQSLPDLTWQAQSTCDRINRVFFEDQAEAMRLFHDLVPGAGDGVDFRPPINLDYGIGLTIGDRTFINKDFLIVGGGYVEIGSDCLNRAAMHDLHSESCIGCGDPSGRLGTHHAGAHRLERVAGRERDDLPGRRHR